MSKENIYIDGLHVLSYKQPAHSNKNIVFVHGAWHGSWCWEEYYLPYFQKKGYNCYALDLRSHGLSNPKSDWKFKFVSLENYVDDVTRVIEFLNVKEVSLVGHSMGGMIVQKILLKNIPKVSSAIMLAPASPGGVLSSTLYSFRHHPFISMNILLTLSMFPMVKYYNVFKKLFFYSEKDDARLKVYHTKIQNESYRATLIDLLFARIKYKGIKSRILVIAAENDLIFPLKTMRKLSEKLNCQLNIIENSGHDLMLENNWINSADLIDDFLKSNRS